MARMRFDGLDKLSRDLKKMEQNAKRLEGRHEVSFSELFTASFMRRHTRFSSIDELLEAGGFQGRTQEEFDAIPTSELDAHIAKVTKFRSWDELLSEAVGDYAMKQLGL